MILESLVLTNRKGTYGEIITDFDYGSLKYNFEVNGERSISFTAFQTNKNKDIFNSIVNEMLILWEGQTYSIKTTDVKYDGFIVSVDVTAQHIFMEFQNHYIQKDLESEEMNNDETTDEDNKPTMTLSQYLDFGFNGNKLGFSYEIKGKFNKRVAVEDLGDKNGMEFISEGVDLYDYVYYADNKKIYFYDRDEFYELSDEPIIDRLNSDEVQSTINTTELKTYIQGYGKKKTKAETKNYNPIKPKDLSYSGTFIKDGTWRTESVGASYTKTFNCKWGNETLEWTLKKMSKGGVLDVYLDGEHVGKYECYSKTATSEKIIIAQKLKKGSHTFKAVFRGAKSEVDYKKSKPCMYVGTEKSTVLNLTAVLKGTDMYHAYAEYKSPNIDIFGFSEAPTIFEDNILDEEELKKALKEKLTDSPVIEVSTNYLGNYDIKDNNSMMFISESLGYNAELKVVKLTKYHPKLNMPAEVEFSNAKADFVDIQQKTVNNISKITKTLNSGNSLISMPENYSDIVGVTLIDG